MPNVDVATTKREAQQRRERDEHERDEHEREREQKAEAGHERTADVGTMILTDQTLGDVVFALRTSLGRVREEELSTPLALTQWRSVQQWLNDAEVFRRAAAGACDFVRLKAFPLSGVELRALQAEVDQAEARRAAQQISLLAATAGRRRIPAEPQHSAGRMQATSFVLAIALSISLLVNVTWLALLRLGIIVIPHLSFVLAVNSLISLVTLCAWAIHHWHLARHMRAVHWHLPHALQLGNPLHLHTR